MNTLFGILLLSFSSLLVGCAVLDWVGSAVAEKAVREEVEPYLLRKMPSSASRDIKTKLEKNLEKKRGETPVKKKLERKWKDSGKQKECTWIRINEMRRRVCE